MSNLKSQAYKHIEYGSVALSVSIALVFASFDCLQTPRALIVLFILGILIGFTSSRLSRKLRVKITVDFMRQWARREIKK
jgi:hypothetical protein